MPNLNELDFKLIPDSELNSELSMPSEVDKLIFTDKDIPLNASDVGLANVENITNAERIAGLLYNPAYDSDTHTLTLHIKGNATPFVVDLPLEALISNISLNEDNELVIMFEDGSTAEVPLSALLVGVAKSVNGKEADSNGAVSLVLADIPGLAAALAGKEPAFTKNTAFNKNFGSAAGTVCEGNDSRLSNARPASGGNADTVDNKHASDFATAAQGTKADTALQSESDPTVPSWAKDAQKPTYTAAEVGAAPASHTHTKSQITDFPVIPAEQIQADWNQSNDGAKDYIKNKPSIPPAYTLPTASETVKGGVKIGTGLEMDGEVLSATGGSGSGTNINVEVLGNWS